MKRTSDLYELGEEIEKQVHKFGQEFHDFVERVVPTSSKAKDFRPEADIITSDKNFSIIMDLPGLTKKEIAITRKQDVLIVQGEKEIELADNEHYKRNERKSGAFIRSFAIPEGADGTKITASFRNGVLTIQLPIGSTDEEVTHIPVQ
ncbi:MAG: Hsp20/alpha crystallin family protein [Bacteroidota bacterium]|nr:Hsp20/alpha crystallin family protein [Bacteroidota bacterium]